MLARKTIKQNNNNYIQNGIYRQEHTAAVLDLNAYTIVTPLCPPGSCTPPFCSIYSMPLCCQQREPTSIPDLLTRFNKIAISNNKFQMASGQGSH